MKQSPVRPFLPSIIALLAIAGTSLSTGAATPADLLAGYAAQAGTSGSPERGQRLFTSLHGRQWSCASCHGTSPTGTGTHAGTGKSIGALAPNVNRERFTDAGRVEKWFRRNCNDVIGRECTAAEKADVISWLLTLDR